MRRLVALILVAVSFGFSGVAFGQVPERVVDVPTRPGVTQRFLYLKPDNPRAAVILFAGGHGGLQISQNGSMGWGEGNFLVRARQYFAERGLAVAVIDAPSDRQSAPYLSDFRQTSEHLTDVKAVIAWLKRQNNLTVWLIGTSRGTQSAAFIAEQREVKGGGPDGLVLTSIILSDRKGRAVPEMELEGIAVPVLAVHHENDGCKHCLFRDIPSLMNKLTGTPRKELITITGGEAQGNPCEARGHHGVNGNEKDVVGKIAEWIQSK